MVFAWPLAPSPAQGGRCRGARMLHGHCWHGPGGKRQLQAVGKLPPCWVRALLLCCKTSSPFWVVRGLKL